MLGSEPVVDGYEGKSGKVWRVSKKFPIADNECVSLSEMINLSDKFISSNQTGKDVTVNLPKGKWHILRIGHTSTGHTKHRRRRTRTGVRQVLARGHQQAV